MRASVEQALRGLLWDKVPRNHRQDPRPFLVRRVVTAVFVVIGAVVLGWSLQIEAGSPTFYLATAILAAVWTVGAFASGPLYLGRILLGVMAVAGIVVFGALAVVRARLAR